MASELLELLLRLALAGSGALLLVLLLRRPLRRLAGAGAAYLCWLSIPLALSAAALPALPAAPALVVALAPGLSASALVASVAPEQTSWLAWIVCAWAGGALATGCLFLSGQRAFVRALGALDERDGVFYAAHARYGPALLGFFRPIIVVPADFALRYTNAEQALILAHERQHAARRDPAANALLALLQCGLWFNPLIHIAASRFRFDQELACDAAVMARHAGQRQAYASAMLKTQSAGAAALATCHWQSSHPLKERIMQLKQTSTSTARRRAGHLIVALLACASVLGTVTARAGAPAAAAGDDYEIVVNFAEGTGSTTAKVRVKAGEDFALRWDQPGRAWKGVFNVVPEGQSVMVKMKVTPDGGSPIAPALLLRLGESGKVVSGDAAKPAFQLGLTVTRAGS
jgi:bla regulator protein BlaR1